MKIFLRFILFTAFCIGGFAHASNYKIVLVHGFQPDNLGSQPNAAQVEQNGALYWSDFWSSRAHARIDWPPHERVTGKIATDYAWPKLRQMAIDGTCNAGCIFVTHSTGDLVTRYLLDNQALWLENEGLTPLNIIATFDFAGAGGGSELADIAVNTANGSGLIDQAARFAISLWLGVVPSESNLGVVNDLRVNNARQLAAFPSDRVPRLRFVGGGSDYLGATSLFIPGTDDGVVSAHSSCGASTPGDFDSCSKSVAFDGKLENQNKGVANFFPQHYPVIMSQNYSHEAVIGAQSKGSMTLANSGPLQLGNHLLNVKSYDEEHGFWFFKTRYRVVTDSNRFSMSDVVVRSLN